MSHNGVDLASYQGNITAQELEALRAAGIEYAYVKATQGTDYINPFAAQQVKALRSAGIHVGLYHFLDITKSMGEEAQYFVAAAASLGGSDLPLALDSEEPDGAGWQDLASKMVAFAMQVENEPLIVRSPLSVFYVNMNFSDNLTPLGFPWGRLVWLADPNPGAPHRSCLILQSAPRPEAGFSSIDPDVFLGSDAQWAAFVTSGMAPNPTPVPQPPKPIPTPAPVPAPAPAPQPQEFDVSTLPTLTNGSKGDVVKSVQALLNGKFNQVGVKVDGDYGPVTAAAVEAVQHYLGLKVDGVTGPATWTVLLNA